MASNPRRANGSARSKLRTRLRAEGRGCWICRVFGRDDRIDYSLPPGHPMSFEVDELVPVSEYPRGGYASARECALDYRNVDATHRRCNQWRGKKSVAQVLALAKGSPEAGRSSVPRAVKGAGDGRW